MINNYAVEENGVLVLYCPAFFEATTQEERPEIVKDKNVKLKGRLYNCSAKCYQWNVKSLDVSELDTSESISFAYMFDEFTCETALDLTALDTRKAETMQQMFYKCKVPYMYLRLDTSRVTDARHMFCKCTTHDIILRANMDFPKLMPVDAWGMFEQCDVDLLDVEILHYNPDHNTRLFHNSKIKVLLPPRKMRRMFGKEYLSDSFIGSSGYYAKPEDKVN